jgi:carnitine 3-dehydrogenase
MSATPPIRTAGILGTGVIGAGWAARFLFRGLDVVAWDPAAGAEQKMRAAIEVAWPSMAKLGFAAPPKPGTLAFAASPEEVAARADHIQEAAPEREKLKIDLFKTLDGAARPEVLIASSSSGFLPSRLQSECRQPERVLIGHPFNPVYLLPLVETVPGPRTSPAAMARARAFYESIGMHVLELRKEIPGYVCDRLQEALWREALHILDKDVATTGEIDDSIVYSAGLRWAFMGSFLTYHLAGGAGGMRDFIKQFDPSLELPWTDLKFPKWSDALSRKLVEGCEAQAGGRAVKELEALRNDILVDLMRVLFRYGIGAGTVLAREEAARYAARAPRRWSKGDAIDAPLELHQSSVQPQWVDYNGHMSESFYLYAFGDASDALFRYVGIDEAYRAAGHSFYTVESHINYLREVSSGEPLRFSTQLLGLDAKRLHLFHRMHHGRSGELLGTTEQMLLHVDMKAQKSSPIRADVHAALAAIRTAHRNLPRPEQQGRVMRVPDEPAN